MTHRRPVLVLAFALAALLTGACDKPRPPENPAEMKEKLWDKVKLALWKVDATDPQRAQMDAMIGELAVDLFAFQEEDKVIKQGIIAALDAEQVDVPALQTHQQTGLNLFDRYTKRMITAAADAAKILTREQRRELVGMWRDWELGDD